MGECSGPVNASWAALAAMESDVGYGPRSMNWGKQIWQGGRAEPAMRDTSRRWSRSHGQIMTTCGGWEGDLPPISPSDGLHTGRRGDFEWPELHQPDQKSRQLDIILCST